jgi:hypothetical protein
MGSGIGSGAGRMGKVGASAISPLSLFAIAAIAIVTGGCGSSSNSSPAIATPKPALSGTVRAGTDKGSVISGAQVIVYQAGANGYGTGSVQLATTTSGQNGGFSIKKIDCQVGANVSQQVYIVAIGGKAKGQSAANAAIVLSAVIGTCGNLPKSKVVVNEATTVAAAWALNQFLDTTGQNMGTSSTNLAGLANSVATITSLALIDPHTGLTPPIPPSGISPPSATLNTIANILSGCVNSAGATSTDCQALFTAATPPAGTTPTTILGAAIAIARNPANNVDALFALQTVSASYFPSLASPPDSWVLALNYNSQSAAFNSPYALALDAIGNVWVVNAGGDNVSELVANSGYTTAFNRSPAGAALSFPASIALDTAGNVWTANLAGNSVSEITAASDYATGLNFAPTDAAFNQPISIAIDAAGNIWLTNFDGNSVSEFTAASSYATGLNFTPAGANFDGPISIDVDAASNIWIANYLGDSVSELTVASSYATGLNFAPAGAAFTSPIWLALDPVGNVWVANAFGDSVSELTAASGFATGLNFAPMGAALVAPVSLAFDGAGNLWIVNQLSDSFSELTASSGYATGFNFAPANTLGVPFELALDASGNVWAVNNQGGSVTELIGVATPVLTPLQACLVKGHDVCTP